MSQSLRDDDGISNPSLNRSLSELIDSAVAQDPSRRRLLKSGLGLAAIPFLGGLAACGGGDEVATTPTPVPEQMLSAAAVSSSTGSDVVVPAGYVATAFAPWGTPINDLAPGWKVDASGTAEEQE